MPRVSVVIPAYRSEATIAKSLLTLEGQSFTDYEIVVVDSSPDDLTERIVKERFPAVRYQHSSNHLLPYAARNRGIEISGGRFLVFTDPDIYAPASWLDRLVAAHQRLGGVISGAIACYGKQRIESGMHFCKFDMWLPGGDERRVELVATANMLCDRDTFEAVGGFKEDSLLSDTLMSWSLEKMGVAIWFSPQAVVEHHHLGNWGSLLRERFSRGKEFAFFRLEWERWSSVRVLVQALASLIPIRLVKLTLRGMVNARRANQLSGFLSVSPIVMSGQTAWLLGEAAAYSAWLKGARKVS